MKSVKEAACLEANERYLKYPEYLAVGRAQFYEGWEQALDDLFEIFKDNEKVLVVLHSLATRRGEG